jgi:hypothetical protein
MNKKTFIALLIFFYLLSTGVSYFLFSKPSSADDPGVSAKKAATGNDYEALTFDPNAKKTEACPLTGELYSKEQQKWWESHRPLGVMIENHEDSRPQSGLSLADVVYEAVAEGGITRTLSVFFCQDAGIIGPVRSARTYFLDFISEYGSYPLYAHVGGANTPGPANALGQIGDYGWNGYNDLNQFSIGFPTFRRDESRLGRSVATEHTMYSVTSKLWEVGKKRGLGKKDKDGDSWDENFTPYSFKDDLDTTKRPATQSIHLEWDATNYAVDWVYSKEENRYLRKNGASPHKDRNTGKQLSAKNVIVLFMRESRANDGYEDNLHVLYGTKGTGNAAIFLDGKQVKGTWKKSGREARTELFDESGDELKLNRGNIWFEIQPTGATVTVK